MGTAAILYRNLADAGVVTASSWYAATPPAFLQNAHVARRWKGRAGDTEYILLDLLSPQSIDTLALLACQKIADDDAVPMTSAAVTRVRISTVDATGVAGDAWDSLSAAGRISEKYASLVILRPAPVTGRYVRIDLSEAGATAILAGRLVVGLRSPFTINFSYGWSFGYLDLSRRRKSAGGQTFIDRDDKYRILNLSFDALEEEDRYDFVHEIDRLNGLSDDVLFIIDPESVQPDRDCVWGLIQDTSPPSQPNMVFFSKSYSIEERR